MGKCVDKGYHPYVKITVCDGCFHRDVCENGGYLEENVCADKMGWISVKDRLPIIPQNATSLNNYKKCIVSDECKNVKECHFVRRTIRGKTIERWEEPSGRLTLRKITHWMPLPDPPKEELKQ